MGKASRIKKERKEKDSARIAAGSGVIKEKPAAKSSSNVRAGMQALLERLGGGNLVVIDGNGVAHRDEDARQMYWADVNEGIRNRGAACLPEMEALGRLMNLSILDVKTPVVHHASGREIHEDIFTAMFLLGHVDCFHWLLAYAGQHGCDWQMFGTLFVRIVRIAPDLEVESPMMAMAKMLVRFLAEAFHRNGYLEEAMADVGKTMGQPFARRIAQDYLDELAAQKERADLDAALCGEEGPANVAVRRI